MSTLTNVLTLMLGGGIVGGIVSAIKNILDHRRGMQSIAVDSEDRHVLRLEEYIQGLEKRLKECHTYSDELQLTITMQRATIHSLELQKTVLSNQLVAAGQTPVTDDIPY